MNLAPLTDDSPIDPDDELLVAYLDGELDSDSRGELEQRLLDNESLRHRLKYLQASWEWLEELPDPTINEKSVETTLEFVVSDLAAPPPPRASWGWRYRWPLTLGALCLVAALGAATAVTLQRRAAFHRELTDLAVVENLKAYLYGSDFALMRQLAADPEWNKTIATSQQVGELHTGSTPTLVGLPVPKRAQAISQLPDDDRTRLAYRWAQFEAQSESYQQELRRTASAVAAQPDAETLLETMRIYAVWRESLPPELRDRIERGDATDRAEAIDEAVLLTQQGLTRRSGTLLDADTTERIYFALQHILQRRLSTLSLEGRENHQKFLDRVTPHWRPQDIERMGIGYMLEGSDEARRRSRGSDRSGGELRRPLSPEEIDMIEIILPRSALDDLDTLAGGDPLLEAATLAVWAEEAVRRKLDSHRGGPRSLLERYQRLDPAERAQYDLLPAEKLLERLTREERRLPFAGTRPPSRSGDGR